MGFIHQNDMTNVGRARDDFTPSGTTATRIRSVVVLFRLMTAYAVNDGAQLPVVEHT
jgi:hypothetical protein